MHSLSSQAARHHNHDQHNDDHDHNQHNDDQDHDDLDDEDEDDQHGEDSRPGKIGQGWVCHNMCMICIRSKIFIY